MSTQDQKFADEKAGQKQSPEKGQQSGNWPAGQQPGGQQAGQQPRNQPAGQQPGNNPGRESDMPPRGEREKVLEETDGGDAGNPGQRRGESGGKASDK